MYSVCGELNQKSNSAVLIPSYCDNEGLIKTLDSLEDEEYINIVIVDDGSYVSVASFLVDYTFKQNIVVITLESNKGIVEALNTGLKFLHENNVQYVFRLDACDINVKGRFAKQLDRIRSTNSALVGGCVEFFFEESNHTQILRLPSLSKEIAKKQFYRTCFVHPAVLLDLNKLNLDYMYSSKFKHAEDYELFLRITQKFNTTNVEDIVTKCIIRNNGLSLSNRKMQVFSVLKAQITHFKVNNVYSYIGVIKTSILLIAPRSFVEIIKKKVFSLYE